MRIKLNRHNKLFTGFGTNIIAPLLIAMGAVVVTARTQAGKWPLRHVKWRESLWRRQVKLLGYNKLCPNRAKS